MAQTSPSEFLTFYRMLRTPATQTRALYCLARPAAATRPFSSSIGRRGDIGSDREHVLDKGKKNDPNAQSHASKAGREHRATNSGGTATQQKDTTGSTEKAKKQHPEAPDTVIGMQDERGGKGV